MSSVPRVPFRGLGSQPIAYPFRHTWDRARYVVPWLFTRPTEATVQHQILNLLAMLGVRAFPVDAGAKVLRGRALGAMRRAGLGKDAAQYLNRGRAGAAAEGVSDIIGVLPGGRALFVEVKQPEWLALSTKTQAVIQDRAAGEPTDDQLRFLLGMHEQGALVTVAWSTEDVTDLLRASGALPEKP